MAKVGDSIQPGQPAPEPGLYHCTAAGCKYSFTASIRGTPLPTAHHPGSMWKLSVIKSESKPTATSQTKSKPPTAAPPAASASTQPTSQAGSQAAAATGTKPPPGN